MYVCDWGPHLPYMDTYNIKYSDRSYDNIRHFAPVFLLIGSHSSHSCNHELLLSWQHTHLFDSHHGLHELGGVSEGQTGQTTIPVHQVVVYVSSH